MKTIIYYFMVLILVFSLIWGCKRDTKIDSNINSEPQFSGRLTHASDCKGKPGKSTNVISDSTTCIEYSYDSPNKKLFLKHINAGFNCGSGQIYCAINLNNDTIIFNESEQYSGADCDCLYDLDMEVTGIKAQHYFIKFIEPYIGNQLKLEFDIDLTVNDSSSFCVTRHHYPWG